MAAVALGSGGSRLTLVQWRRCADDGEKKLASQRPTGEGEGTCFRASGVTRSVICAGMSLLRAPEQFMSMSRLLR